MTIREIALSDSSRVDYLKIGLSSLAIECNRTNELNDKQELEALANSIKEV